ncbi:MAG: substrate-binding domain-containing protein [Spirochaetales bacterium]|nr:substrate-binding domain-containing protein [Spirochaetales bacterium]
MKKRPLVAVLLDDLNTPYQITILNGIKRGLTDENCNILCFEGSSLKAPNPFDSAKNRIYDFSLEKAFDGYIILTPTLGQFMSKDEFSSFLAKYKSRPIVSIGSAIEGIPSVMEDNAAGFTALMKHLCKDHQYKRLAFIRGRDNHQSSKERFDIYCEALQSHGIIIRDELIMPGNFLNDSGRDAVNILLDKRKQEFEVIVASNDYMAFGAMSELKNRGITIPFEIAVTGFDDIEISANSHPPLTTVRQPLFRMGEKAAHILCAAIWGESVPEKVFLPAELIIRDSCGCQCLLKPYEISGSKKRSLEYKLSAVCDGLVQKCQKGERPDKNLIKLLEGLPELMMKLKKNGDGRTFLSRIMKYLITPLVEKTWLSEFKECIATAFTLINPGPDKIPGVDIIYFKTLSFIQQKEIEFEQYSRNIFFNSQYRLNMLQANLLFSLKLESQVKQLENNLASLGLDRFIFCLYEKKPGPLKYECLTAVNQGKIVKSKTEKSRHNLMKLLNTTIIGKEEKYSLIIVPLQDLGFIVINLLDEHFESFYTLLENVISVPLRCALLFEKLDKQQKSLENNLEVLRMAMSGFIEMIALTIEVRDPYTAGHQRRVSDLSRSIATEMGCTEEEIECVRMAGIVHDLGKISVPSEILNKPGRLSEVEFTLIKHHPKTAYDILIKINFPWPIAEVILQHHERIDGSGYPSGLKGDQIRREAKILAVADVVEAMASYRPYRPSLGIDKALEEINDKRGKCYDEKAVAACLRLFNKKGYELIS